MVLRWRKPNSGISDCWRFGVDTSGSRRVVSVNTRVEAVPGTSYYHRVRVEVKREDRNVRGFASKGGTSSSLRV